MSQIDRVDVSRFVLGIHRGLSVCTRTRKSDPPERIDGMTVGIQMVTQDAPHDGEMHPDGDGSLAVISGKFRWTGDSAPEAPLDLEPGDARIVRKASGTHVSVLEPGQIVHIPPGPRGGHMPKGSE